MGRRRRRPLPTEPALATVEKLTHDGRGIAYVDGKAIFITGALPGETVRFRYIELRRDHGSGQVVEVLRPAPERVAPPCSAFGRCGGCSLQHLDHAAQIRAKEALLAEQLRRIGGIDDFERWPPLAGPVWGYRRKARLGVRYVRNKGKVLVGFRERGSGKVAEIESCLTLHPRVGERLQDLAGLIDALSIREQLPQIEVAIGDNRSALAFRVLQSPRAEDRQRLSDFGRRCNFDIYLQPKGPESLQPLCPADPPLPCYFLPEDVTLWFGPLDFTQVNADINHKMIARVLETLAPRTEETLLDLFCGLGNFTLPLARRGGRIVGVEGNPRAVEMGRYNARANGIDNVEFHVCDLTQPLGDQPWAEARYDKILLDPARSGALELMAWLPRWRPKQVVYVSCNPATLARDVGRLVHEHGFRLIRAGIMDMFPHTAHVESIALLTP
ncbi:23S rRNA (uracil1939-C5)-methyltransferase [Methylomarinovum tepidoasis]|uniref:23S rRNA (uracil(1939)-C(5))-methyltransferase RlmD n=1 Tax=Methylomarinovum tepidoasis TaxID=2840183 RepID=A0AAU9CSW5_9GAMM|nr:23S rRNA (uracil(1939)-C(5))-methyltransferase RlmD [Methylomarinovum sp. IN45]BCX89448.1 23S rRNA (uracil1939-C5)-methyltransferase [Methylomarinovum sp. IN45]